MHLPDAYNSRSVELALSRTKQCLSLCYILRECDQSVGGNDGANGKKAKTSSDDSGGKSVSDKSQPTGRKVTVINT